MLKRGGERGNKKRVEGNMGRKRENLKERTNCLFTDEREGLQGLVFGFEGNEPVLTDLFCNFSRDRERFILSKQFLDLIGRNTRELTKDDSVPGQLNVGANKGLGVIQLQVFGGRDGVDDIFGLDGTDEVRDFVDDQLLWGKGEEGEGARERKKIKGKEKKKRRNKREKR